MRTRSLIDVFTRARLIALLTTALLVPAFAPAAEADHCGPIIVFGRITEVSGVGVGANAGGVGCAALGEDAPDVKEITPGSPNIQVRFIGNLGVDTLQATVDGLGLSQGVTLTLGGGSYNSALIPIDPLATGDVTVVVETPDGRTVTSTFTKSA